MKNYVLSLLAIACLFTACDKDDDDTGMTAPEYTIQIMSPNADDKKVGDMVHIHVNFDETNQETIHHVKVTIKNKADGTEIYSGPSEAHVHEASGHFEHHDDIMLDVDGHSDWILEAKVWGHEAGAAEKMETLEFHVHPN